MIPRDLLIRLLDARDITSQPVWRFHRAALVLQGAAVQPWVAIVTQPQGETSLYQKKTACWCTAEPCRYLLHIIIIFFCTCWAVALKQITSRGYEHSSDLLSSLHIFSALSSSLLSLHQTACRLNLSLYADSAFLVMCSTTIVSCENLTIRFPWLQTEHIASWRPSPQHGLSVRKFRIQTQVAAFRPSRSFPFSLLASTLLEMMSLKGKYYVFSGT